tara:strand:- start:1796 stop:2632 length:837 start_codon:yes stop_codon:yes gene_type:complete
MATVNLGNIKFNWKGAYNGSTAYVVDDVVSNSGSSYICILASTGNAPTNTTYWQQMSAAGTNGTDIGTTITTQGDLLYRDGSGLQRLAAGTAGQVLQTGGSGANPSWTNVSSDFVKVHSTFTDSSNSSYHDYVHFSDTYQHYRVIYTDDGTASGTSHFLRVGNGSIDTSSNYRWQAHYTSNASTGSHGSTSSGEMRVGWSGDGSGYNNTNIVDFLNTRDSSQATTIFARRFCKDHASTYLNVTMGGRHEVNGVIDRFRIYNDSGNIIIKNITIYGMKT